MAVTTGISNVVLGRLPSYTRKSRHLDLLMRYARPRKIANIARAELSMARGDIELASRPYVYTVDTGNLCNLRCPLCPTGSQNLQRRQHLMTHATFERVLEKISPWAIEVILHNWGEPFLNPDILKIIRSAREASVGTTISSHLNLVHRGDDFLGDVVEAGLDHLTVSLDGTTQDVYGIYRRGGNLEKVLHNLSVILDRRRKLRSSTPVVEWQFLVMKHNEHQVEEARAAAKKLGVDRIRFTSAGLPFDDLENQKLAAQWLSDLPEYQAYNPKKIRERGYMFDERCFYLYRGMTINPGGEVSPCCVVYHAHHDFGNILDSDLESVWNNRQYKASRALFSRKPAEQRGDTVCEVCPLFKFESQTSRS
jgi:radical SAM protein with 4Fe4S-binding SPASM domain